MKPCFVLLLLFFFAACNNAAKNNGDGGETKAPVAAGQKASPAGAETNNTLSTNSEAAVMHNIVVRESGGLNVARAYLSFEDGSLVPKTNRVALGQTVYLNLIIDKGWTVEDGAVSLDASERIEAHDGRLVLNAPNLFKSMPLIAEEKAAHLFLKATITRTQPDVAYFVVNYHVWDKRGEADVKGNYKLYVE